MNEKFSRRSTVTNLSIGTIKIILKFDIHSVKKIISMKNHKNPVK